MYTCSLKFKFRPVQGPNRVPKTAALLYLTPVISHKSLDPALQNLFKISPFERLGEVIVHSGFQAGFSIPL